LLRKLGIDIVNKYKLSPWLKFLLYIFSNFSFYWKPFKGNVPLPFLTSTYQDLSSTAFCFFQLLTLLPSYNALALAFRDKDTLRFVKYINSVFHGCFHTLQFTYYENSALSNSEEKAEELIS